MDSYKLPFQELNLQPKVILREIGYGIVEPDVHIVNMVNELLVMLKKGVVVEYVFKIFQGKVFNSTVHVENEIFNAGSTICSLLVNSSSFAIFAATAGQQFELLMNRIKEESDMIKIYLLDMIGSCIAEKTGDLLEQHLKSEIQGLKHTHRFSPGYCGWHLTEQQKIFRLLGGNPCNIQLSKVCLMNPIKSISGVIGIGEDVKQKLYACNICELENCYKRKQKNVTDIPL